MSAAAVVLAAGASVRLGRPKQLVPWGESNLLGHVTANAAAFGVDEVWVVLGCAAEEIMAETDLGDAGIVVNPEWEEGIASSLRAGLDAVARLSRCDTAVIALGDQPDVSPATVGELLAAHAGSGRPVTVPRYRQGWGNPAVVDRSLWERLMSLEGDEGAMRLWRAHPGWVNEVRFDGPPPGDVDTEADVDELRPGRD